MQRLLPKFHSESQMRALATSPCPTGQKGLRDRALLGMLCGSGLRASELCGLLVRDVQPSLVFVRNAKFGKERWVPLARNTWYAVQAYLAVHPAHPDQPLFRTIAGGGPLTRRLLHKLVASYARPLGLRGAACHSLRHSCATRWLNKGVNLQSVRVMLGHEHIATTAIYCGTALNALVAEYQRCVDGRVVNASAR